MPGDSGGGLFEAFGNVVGGYQKAKKDKENQTKENAQRQKLFNSLDFTPEYASNNVPQYQKTQSPIASAYLNSLLLGANPDSVRPGSANAGMDRQLAQQRKDLLFGDSNTLLQQQQAAQANPYKVTAPKRSIVPNQDEQWAKINPMAAKSGITTELVKSLQDGKGGDYGRVLAESLTNPSATNGWVDYLGQNGLRRIAEAAARGDDLSKTLSLEFNAGWIYGKKSGNVSDNKAAQLHGGQDLSLSGGKRRF